MPSIIHFKSLKSLPVLQGQYRLQKGSSEGWLSSQLLAFTCCSARVSNQVPMTLPAWRLGQIADIPAKSEGTVLKGWFIQWKIACIFMFITHRFDLLFFIVSISLMYIISNRVFFCFWVPFPRGNTCIIQQCCVSQLYRGAMKDWRQGTKPRAPFPPLIAIMPSLGTS